jgi:hypothetical protein
MNASLEVPVLFHLSHPRFPIPRALHHSTIDFILFRAFEDGHELQEIHNKVRSLTSDKLVAGYPRIPLPVDSHIVTIRLFSMIPLYQYGMGRRLQGVLGKKLDLARELLIGIS